MFPQANDSGDRGRTRCRDRSSLLQFHAMPRPRSKAAAPQPPARWERTYFEEGLATYQLKTWSAFPDFLDAEVFTIRGRARHRFIWRGQRRSDWMLASSLDRLFDRLEYKGEFKGARPKTPERRSQEHLEDFKYAARGRRGFNPPRLDENEGGLWGSTSDSPLRCSTGLTHPSPPRTSRSRDMRPGLHIVSYTDSTGMQWTFETKASLKRRRAKAVPACWS
jgi:hypothetical protein